MGLIVNVKNIKEQSHNDTVMDIVDTNLDTPIEHDDSMTIEGIKIIVNT